MLSTPNPLSNALLASLPTEVIDALSPQLEWIAMPLGSSLYRSNELIKHAYFPCTSIVSLHYTTISGDSPESASVGCEGIVGTPIFMGAASTLGSAMVHIGGHGFRIDRRTLQREFERSVPMQRVLLRYTQSLMEQIALTATCYRYQTVEQKLSRWLLTTLDRMPGKELVMTQELLASLLGVRRESITQAAGNLRDLGHISYRRGHISVLNVSGLRRSASERYGAEQHEPQRMAA